MFRTLNLDCDTPEGKKPIEFLTVSALEYYLGWTSKYAKDLEEKGWLPRTPYVSERQFPRKGSLVRLYTKTQIQELTDLVENHYPVLYRGRNPVLQEYYKEQIRLYLEQVKRLQQKWNEEDYIAKEPATPPPLRKKRKYGVKPQ